MRRVIILLASLTLVCCESPTLHMTKTVTKYENSRTRRATSECSNDLPDTGALKSHTDVHVFANDSNPAISIVWTGTKGALLALTTLDMSGFASASKLYRSTDYGRSFKDISAKIGYSLISKSHGMLVSPVDSNYVIFIDSASVFSGAYGRGSKVTLYVTTDSGESFQRITCPFNLKPSTLIYNHLNHLSIAALSAYDNALWLSHDFGLVWQRVDQNVLQIRWDPTEDGFLYYTRGPDDDPTTVGFKNEFYRVSTNSPFPKVKIAEHIYSFGIQGGYIFISVEYLNHNGSRVMHVSKDRGANWEASQIPLIGAEQFYSLLDMSEDMVFVHVDEPGSDGDGVIYTSDERGIIYSKSLEHHLYPALGSVTDFYKVQSLHGVYITSQLDDNLKTIHSMITFDKGGVWQKIDPPRDRECAKSEKECYLQIHSLFSQNKGVRLPDYPKSTKSAPGIILAHGNIGDGLNFNSPDVYVSNDGGYSWVQPGDLKGPHYYGIGDSGGILYAVPAFTPTNVVKFSLDEGQCWHEYKFLSNSTILVTGVSLEPGSRSTLLGMWGWDKNGDGAWRSVTVDFSPFLQKTCGKEDYEVWTAHESNNLAADACLLGSQVVFKKRKKGRICINGKSFENEAVLNPCQCVKTDYLCDYGYVRTVKSDCVEDNEFMEAHLDICVDGDENVIQTQGYRKIPGDKCVGGFEPTSTVVSRHKSCIKTEIRKDDFGTNPDDFSVSDNEGGSTSSGGIIVILVLAIVALICVVLYLMKKRNGIRMRMKYTRLATNEPTHNLIDDEESGPDSPDTPVLPNGKGFGSISYHDDSDEDLLVT